MKKRFSVLCSAVAVFALLVTVMGIKSPLAEIKYDVSYASVEQCYDDADDMNTTMKNEPTEETTGSDNPLGGIGLGDIGEVVSSFSGSDGGLGEGFVDGIGGIGGIFGDAGDLLGSVLGGSGSVIPTTGVINTTIGDNNVVYIDPVPAATQPITQGTTIVPVPPTTAPVIPQSTLPIPETLNPDAKTNPYSRPAGVIRPGDMGDGVKWIQWNIIYSGYGLEGKVITGVYDDATVEAVKKLQTEKGLTADGIVNDAVIDKIENLYFEYITGNAPVTVPGTTVGDTTSVGIIGGTDDNSEGNALIIILAIFLIIVIWVIAIIVIVIILIVKKKKKKKSAAAQSQVMSENATQENPEKIETEKQNNDMSLADLFEEANNKKK